MSRHHWVGVVQADGGDMVQSGTSASNHRADDGLRCCHASSSGMASVWPLSSDPSGILLYKGALSAKYSSLILSFLKRGLY